MFRKLKEFFVKTTYYAKPGEVQREWLLIDAAEGKDGGMVLGRLATEVANILRGKNKPQYTPHVDTGDFVIIINADKVRLTGNKEDEKVWYRHSGYIGGLKKETWREAMEKHPERIIERAVKGMLPKTTLGQQQFTKLRVYAGPEYKEVSQKPRKITVEA
ncbi:MAG: 50S ribosomal protein L13 [Coriobacteriales bacterium]|nr:50S ribosomal protein L13 [Coriobacteriales bacterium]